MKSSFSKLSEVADVVDSLHKTPKYSDNGAPMVRCTDVKYGRLELKDTLRVNDKVFEEFSRRYKPNKGDIIITRVGSYGITALVDETNFCLGQNTSAIIPKINPRYLYVALNSPQVKNQIEFSVVGSTQKTLSLKAINNLEIPRFDEEKEDAIAEIIGGLDDKIELNRQTNQTLEQIAQAIFKSWFVDFDPVRAKIAAREAFIQQHPEVTLDAIRATAGTEGDTPAHAAAKACELAAICAISGKTDEELDQLSPDQLQKLAAIAALFPNELEDSNLGEIPRGWVTSNVGSEFDVTMGQSPPGDTYNEVGEGMPFFQGRRDFGWRYPANRVYCTAPKRLARKGDTLLSVRAPVGDVNKSTSDCCVGRGISALRHKSGCEAYTYYSIQRLEKHFNSFDSEGTVFGSINQKDLKGLSIINPANELLTEFSTIVGNIDEKIRVLEDEIATLSDLRDSLLPKLLSGEITLCGTRSTTEAVA